MKRLGAPFHDVSEYPCGSSLNVGTKDEIVGLEFAHVRGAAPRYRRHLRPRSCPHLVGPARAAVLTVSSRRHRP